LDADLGQFEAGHVKQRGHDVDVLDNLVEHV
jgi:hypothetical protein